MLLAGTWLASRPPAMVKRMVFFLGKHTFLLLTDAAGKHMAGYSAPRPKRGEMFGIVLDKHTVAADGCCRQARGWLARLPP